ncbi:MAG: SDR family NAD(P)-dependent oxidoreductase, partial [Candidatus Aminicenantes bacterium]
MQDQFLITGKHRILKNHRAYGQALLPGLAYIDMLYQIFREHGHDYNQLELRNLSIYHPLTVGQDYNVMLSIRCSQSREGQWQIRVEGQEQRNGILAADKKRYITAEMHRKDPVVFKETLDLDQIKQSAKKIVGLDEMYKQCRRQDLVHTGLMKAEGKIYDVDTAAIIDISLGQDALSTAGGFMFHPTLIDCSSIAPGMLFSSLVKGEKRLFLPLFYESFRAAALLQRHCITRIQTSSLRQKKELAYVTMEFFNESGTKVGELKNLTNKLVREDRLINPDREKTPQPTKAAKSNRSSLTDLKTPIIESEAANTVPSGETEYFLRQLLADRLKKPADQIDTQVGYYEMGLDSPGLLEIVQAIEAKIGTALSPTLLFEYTTIAELATYLTENYPSQFNPPDPPPKKNPIKSFYGGSRGAVFSKSAPLAAGGKKLEEDIAIIGMAGRYPGARTPREFWLNLKRGKDCISEIPKSRWDWHRFDSLKLPPGTSISKWGGFIDDPDCFDAQFFRISPREAEMMDPQERLFLEVCWETIEDAGYTPKTLAPPRGRNKRRHVGVFVGVMHKDYTLVGAEVVSRGQVYPLSLNCAPIANRVSYFCNFHGPSMAIDTLCSSSLTALHLALESIYLAESEVALAGGVNLSLHPNKYMAYGIGNMHSSDGYCHTFGKGGDGYVSGEGIGAVLLKPLSKAIQDHDHIYAVIKGSTINHGGTVSGLTVPSPLAQADMIAACLEKTGIHPRTISYVEAHGTGTSLGDPIEIQGLVKAYRHYTPDRQFCSIGSVKSNIGHGESAAGISGLSKAALQLYYKTTVPSLHSEELNPYIDFRNSPFYVQQKTGEWKQPIIIENDQEVRYPRRAGLSSFGAAGANAHVILEEYLPKEAQLQTPTIPGTKTTPVIVPLSARNKERLHAYAGKLLEFLKGLPLNKTPVQNKEKREKSPGKILETKLHRILSGVLQVNPEAIEVEQEWNEYGVDAVHLTQVKEKILEELNIQIDANALNQESSIASAAAYLLNYHQEAPGSYDLTEEQEINPADLAYTLQLGREAREERLVFIVKEIPGLIQKLEAFLQNKEDIEHCYQGQVKQYKETLSLFTADEDSKELIHKWITKGRIEKLAELWAKGLEIDWDLLYSETGVPRPRRISLPTYPFARERYWVPEPDSQPADSAAAARQSGSTSGETGRAIMLAPLWDSIPVEKDQIFPTPIHQVVIVGGTKDNRQAIQQVYPKARAMSIQPGETIDEIAQKLEAHGLIDHILWIAPHHPLKSPADDSLIEEQHQGILHCFRMIKALLGLGYGTRDLGWSVITIQTQTISKNDWVNLAVNPAHASLHGLIGSMAKEYPNWKIRLVDLEADCDWPLADIFTLPPDPRGDTWGYRGQEWYRQKLIPLHRPPVDQTLYRTGGVYVVIGGAGGIGAAWSEYMIRTYQARITWIGRRQKDKTLQAKLDSLAAQGPAPHYITADATDRQALYRAYEEIKQRYSQIHGVIHSAVGLLDKSLAKMEEERFQAGLSAKIDVSVRMAQVFQKETLDFILFFSSIGSFARAHGQSSYSAGCAFKDAFAHQLAQKKPPLVKVMNWGYWGDIGVGSIVPQAYKNRLQETGLGAIDPGEAMEALEILLAGPLAQMALIKTTTPQARERMNPGEEISVYPENVPASVQNLRGHIQKPEQDPQIQRMKPGIGLEMKEMGELLCKLLWGQLQSIGLFTEKNPVKTDLEIKTRLHDLYHRWFEESMAVLVRNNYLQYDGEAYVVVDTTRMDIDEVWKEWDLKKARWLADPNKKAQVVLVEATLRALPEILTGKRPATDVMFPNSSMELVEGIFKHNIVADYFNDVLANTVVAYIQERLQPDSPAPLRIFEIGAGTGGTSTAVFKKLKPYREQIQEYCYTDISKAFLMYAEKEYGPGNPYLTYQIFNVEEPVAGQGIPAGAYDIVIAANVLHATRNIRQTLRNVKALLRKNGLLLLNELNRNSLVAFLTFGLLEGWWLYDDPALRIPGCPGLYPDTWQTVLESEGFRSVFFPAQEAHDFGQQIVAAESDGVVRQKQPLKPSPAPREMNTETTALKKPPSKQKPATTPVEEITPGLLREKTRAYFKKLVGETLKIPNHKIDSSEPLVNYGIDSILASQLNNALSKVFDNISSTLFFEYQTIEALVEHFIETQRDSLIEVVGLENQKLDETIAGNDKMLIEPSPAAPNFTGGKSTHLRQSHDPVINGSGPRPSPGPVAIIGMSGRFPGANTPGQYWGNLLAGKNSITEIPPDRWDWKEYYHENPNQAAALRKSYSKWGGFLDEFHRFDPLFFNMTPREAENIDPQERLFLEECWKAMEDAGYAPSKLSPQLRQKTGVFGGITKQGFNLYGVETGQHFPSTSFSSLVNRVSYFMDLQGPSIPIDTMCSSSLAAIHEACEYIRGGRGAMAIAGGVNLYLHPSTY